MKNEHLTDEKLQACLDTGRIDEAAEKHLATCPQCRMVLEAYRLVWQALAEEPAYKLAPDFDRHVVDLVGKEMAACPSVPKKERGADRAIVLAFLAGLVGAAIFFVQYPTLAAILSSWTSACGMVAKDIVGRLNTSISLLGLDWRWIMAVAFSLGAVALVDRIVRRRPNRQRIHLLV